MPRLNLLIIRSYMMKHLDEVKKRLTFLDFIPQFPYFQIQRTRSQYNGGSYPAKIPLFLLE